MSTYIVQINIYPTVMSQDEVFQGIHSLHRIPVAIVSWQKPRVLSLQKFSRFCCAPQLFPIVNCHSITATQPYRFKASKHTLYSHPGLRLMQLSFNLAHCTACGTFPPDPDQSWYIWWILRGMTSFSCEAAVWFKYVFLIAVWLHAIPEWGLEKMRRKSKELVTREYDMYRSIRKPAIDFRRKDPISRRRRRFEPVLLALWFKGSQAFFSRTDADLINAKPMGEIESLVWEQARSFVVNSLNRASSNSLHRFMVVRWWNHKHQLRMLSKPIDILITKLWIPQIEILIIIIIVGVEGMYWNSVTELRIRPAGWSACTPILMRAGSLGNITRHMNPK